MLHPISARRCERPALRRPVEQEGSRKVMRSASSFSIMRPNYSGTYCLGTGYLGREEFAPRIHRKRVLGTWAKVSVTLDSLSHGHGHCDRDCGPSREV
eukprot:52219-Rhodomonas_salina.1